MNAVTTIRHAIDVCGQTVTLVRTKMPNVSFTACVLPRMYADATRHPEKMTVFGPRNPREYVYYGPIFEGADSVSEGSILEVGRERLRVIICHDFYYRGEKVYRWATLVPVREGQDGSIYQS